MKNILEVNQLCKTYPGNTTAAQNVSFSISEGEFVTLLGPSGCGKTTTLRMIAGFELPDSGRIFLDNVDVTDLPPYKRPVNMMFQDFALWPHMSVEKNIGYGLMISGEKKQKIEHEVNNVLDLVDLRHKSKSFPQELSIGQKQRIALARAIVKKPRILLLDEPMSALDAKLRESMQTELRELQKTLQMTFVMVTHDQTEAMRMSDRIIVMRDGQIMQVGSPTELYESPATPYVADFLGRSNILAGITQKPVGSRHIVVAGDIPLAVPGNGNNIPANQPVTLCIRPEKILLKNIDHPVTTSDNILKGTVTNTSYNGNSIRYDIDIGLDINITVDQQLTKSIVQSKVPSPGEQVFCQIPVEAIAVFVE